MYLTNIIGKFKILNPNYLKLFITDKKFLKQASLYQVMNKYKNTLNKVVLVGCGNSISKYKPIENVTYIGINRSFKYENIKLDYLFIQDKFPEGMSEANEYDAETCKKFYGVIPSSTRYLQNNYLNTFSSDDKDVISANAVVYYLKPGCRQRFSKDLNRFPIADLKGTVFSALQFAIYCGAKEIYLVGCDCSAGHFYASKKDSKLNYQVSIWKRMKVFLKQNFSDVKIYSVNPVNLAGLFEDIYQEE